MNARAARRREVRAFGLWAVIVLLAAFWAFVFLGTGLVRAHKPTHTVDCSGISVSGRAYGHGATLTLTVNGVTQTQQRGRDGHFAGLSATFPSTGDTTWSFRFDDPDDRYDLTESGVQQGCAGPATTTTTVAPATTTTEVPLSTTTTTSSLPSSRTTTSTAPTTQPTTSTTTSEVSTTAPSSTTTSPPSTTSVPPSSTPSPVTSQPTPTIPATSTPSTTSSPQPSTLSPPSPCETAMFDPADPATGDCWQLVATS